MIICGYFYRLIPIIAVIFEILPSTASYDQRGYEDGSIRDEIIEENPDPRGRIQIDDTEEVEERVTPRREIIDPEVTDQLEGNGWLDVIPGTPGKDYPNYSKIPETSFSCDAKTPGGYYADVETRCQVFHVCNTDGQKITFICPSGSIFNQKYFVCDWWYDFECDDATDLYSLNEKINRGGTGSGPSGPGRAEIMTEYSSENENFNSEELYRRQNPPGNFLSDDGFDLSLAGTGEGGPGYSRNGNNNNKGYQSNLDDEEEKNNKNRGQLESRGKNGNGDRNINGELSTPENNKKEDKNNREELNTRVQSPRGFSTAFNKDTENGGNNYRRQNSAGRVNYYRGENPSTEYSENGDNQHREDTQRHVKNERRNNNFGRRSPRYENNDDKQGPSYSDESIIKNEEKLTNFKEGGGDIPAVSSGSNNGEYKIPFDTKPATAGKIRGRQRANSGLPGGLGNGYSSPGRARELQGSDVIATSITPPPPGDGGTVYDEEDQVSSFKQNSQRKIYSGRRNPGEITDVQKIRYEYQNEKPSTQTRQDFKDDNYFSQASNHQDKKYSTTDSPRRDYRSVINNREINNPVKNNGNDYLLGIVPGNGSSNSNQSRRFLPIL